MGNTILDKKNQELPDREDPLLEFTDLPKIDVHCHTTTRKIEKVIPPRADLDQIQKEMKRWNISKTALLASYFPARGSGISNFRLKDWISQYNAKNSINARDSPFLMFASLDVPTYFYQGFNEIEELARAGLISGIKIYMGYQEINPYRSSDQKKIRQIADLAYSHDLAIMMHTGSCHGLSNFQGPSAPVWEAVARKTRVANPQELEQIVRHNPQANFIFSHMGGPLTELIRIVQTTHNLYSDMSGLLSSYHAWKLPIEEREDVFAQGISDIRRFLDQCGPSKLLFGTDFPVQTHEDSLYLLNSALKGFSVQDARLVYFENARRLLGSTKRNDILGGEAK